MILKLISSVRMITFIVTLLTTIPLFITYILGSEPTHQLIVHLHVWFGLVFFITAIVNMIIKRRKPDSK